jgi:hypothetical protein
LATGGKSPNDDGQLGALGDTGSVDWKIYEITNPITEKAEGPTRKNMHYYVDARGMVAEEEYVQTHHGGVFW